MCRGLLATQKHGLFLWRNIHLELERARKKDTTANGKRGLFKNSAFLQRESRHSPNATCTIDFDSNYFLVCSITSLYGHPTSINISTKGAGPNTLCFYPADVNALFMATGFPNNSIDVPVRQGTSIINFEKVFEINAQNNQAHIGFRLKQFDFNLIRQSRRPTQCIFIPIGDHQNFQSMLMRADQTVSLQHEIISQQFATFE